MDTVIWLLKLPFVLIGIYIFDVIPALLVMIALWVGIAQLVEYWSDKKRYGANSYRRNRALQALIFGPLAAFGIAIVTRLLFGYPRWFSWFGL
ncbi:MAG: hypothetical protein ACJ8F3_02570 [Xanthobacteraceae bacterium]